MQNLIEYLLKKHITNDSASLLKQLLKLKPVALSPALKISQEELVLIQYLTAKGIVMYSPSQVTLTLNVRMILIFQRLHKLKLFTHKFYHSQFHHMLDKFISNDFLPATVHEKGLKLLERTEEKHQPQKLESKPKKKKEQTQQTQKKHSHNQEHTYTFIDYSRLFYENSTRSGSSEKDEVEVVVHIEELTEQLRLWTVEKWLGKQRSEEMRKQMKCGDQKFAFFIQMYNISKESNSVKADLLKQTITKIKEEKVDEFISQIFRKYDGQLEISQRVSSDCLLTFNILRKSPLLNEKQLTAMSLLPLVQQRKCLNLLIQQGLIHYYPQGPRSIVYKIRQYQQIQQMLIERVSQSLLNLHLLTNESPVEKEQLLKFQCMMADLDDVLLLFQK